MIAATRPAAARRQRAPVPGAEPFLRGAIEAAVLLLALRLAEEFIFGERYFSTLSIHPFWIVVLLAAMQNGLFAGIAAAGLACMFLNWPSRPIGVDIIDHYIAIALQPLTWMISAMVVGMYRSIQLRRETEMRQRLAELTDETEVLCDEIARMDDAVAEAELHRITRIGPDGAIPPSVVAALGDLLDVPMTLTELAARMDRMATHLTPHPAILLIADQCGAFAALSPATPHARLVLPLAADHPVAEALRGTAEPQVLPADLLIPDVLGQVAAAGVYLAGGHDPDGMVLILAADAAGARAALPAAQLMARAAGLALRSMNDIVPAGTVLRGASAAAVAAGAAAAQGWPFAAAPVALMPGRAGDPAAALTRSPEREP